MRETRPGRVPVVPLHRDLELLDRHRDRKTLNRVATFLVPAHPSPSTVDPFHSSAADSVDRKRVRELSARSENIKWSNTEARTQNDSSIRLWPQSNGHKSFRTK